MAVSLEIRGTETFRRREHTATRIGWIVLTTFVIAAIFGFLGPGMWSNTTRASGGGGLQVEYLRVAHIEADDTFTISLTPEFAELAVADDTGMLAVELRGTWVNAINRQSISPTPSEETLLPDGVRMEFKVDTNAPTTAGAATEADNATTSATGGGDVLQIAIQFRAQQLGPLGGTVSVADESVEFSSFVLP